MEDLMSSTHAGKTLVALAVAAALGGCASWDRMDRTEGTAVGGVGGAVAGAVVAGPVGAVVGGVGGAIVGHETTGHAGTVTTRTTSAIPYDVTTIRSVQQALNDRGYNVGPIDGQWGPATQDALRRFQQVSGLQPTGELERPTLVALGVS
jgi:Putative peptidoglycan binding domain